MATIQQDIAGARSQAQPNAMNSALKKAAQRGFPGLGGQGSVKQGINVGKPSKMTPKPAKPMPKVKAKPLIKKSKTKNPTFEQVKKSISKTMGYA